MGILQKRNPSLLNKSSRWSDHGRNWLVYLRALSHHSRQYLNFTCIVVFVTAFQKFCSFGIKISSWFLLLPFCRTFQPQDFFFSEITPHAIIFCYWKKRFSQGPSKHRAWVLTCASTGQDNADSRDVWASYLTKNAYPIFSFQCLSKWWMFSHNHQRVKVNCDMFPFLFNFCNCLVYF